MTPHPRGGRLAAPAPLGSAHDLGPFECGKPELDNWLRDHAFKSEGRTARTYVACEETRVVGFYSLANGGVDHKGLPGKLKRQAPNPVPVMILGRLAVDRSWAGRGLGTDLLADAFKRTVQASRIAGIRAILVHAIDDEARTFYLKRAEFMEYPSGSRTLFLPLETIIDSL